MDNFEIPIGILADFNSWLDENPLVLGLGSTVLGGAAVGWAAWELKTGRYKQKDNPAFRKNKLIQVLGGGIAFLGYGVFTLIKTFM